MKHLPRVLGLVALLVPWSSACGDDFGSQIRPVFIVETYSVSPEDARGILENTHKGGERYAVVLRLEQNGRARLEILNALRTVSGQRSVSESFDQVRYPTELAPGARRGEPASPTSFEDGSVGDSVEWEPVITPQPGGIA